MNGSQGPGNLLKFHVVFVNDTEAIAFIKFSVGFVAQKNKQTKKTQHTHTFLKK